MKHHNPPESTYVDMKEKDLEREAYVRSSIRTHLPPLGPQPLDQIEHCTEQSSIIEKPVSEIRQEPCASNRNSINSNWSKPPLVHRSLRRRKSSTNPNLSIVDIQSGIGRSE